MQLSPFISQHIHHSIIGTLKIFSHSSRY